MLRATPTKKGTGLILLGHPDDLVSLHETLHFLCRGLDRSNDKHEHALSIAYEVRKAFEHKREVHHTESGEVLGTRFVWPQILFYASYFRQLAAYCNTNKEHQSNLALLEHCVETSLVEYDAKIGLELVAIYPNVWAITNEYLDSYVESVTHSFLYDGGSGKLRFRRLPALVRSMHPLSPEYKEFSEMLEREATKKGCKPSDLRDSRPWPEIEW